MNERFDGAGLQRGTARHRRARATRAGAVSTRVVELTEQTGVGEVMLEALIRRQRRLAIRYLLSMGATLASLPVVLSLSTWLRQATVGPVGVVWIVLGGVIYPLLTFVAHRYRRTAERHEREFVELVEQR